MSKSMHIQNLIKFYKVVLKILSENKTMMDEWADGQSDRQPKSYIAPTSSKKGYNNNHIFTHKKFA